MRTLPLPRSRILLLRKNSKDWCHPRFPRGTLVTMSRGADWRHGGSLDSCCGVRIRYQRLVGVVWPDGSGINRNSLVQLIFSALENPQGPWA